MGSITHFPHCALQHNTSHYLTFYRPTSPPRRDRKLNKILHQLLLSTYLYGVLVGVTVVFVDGDFRPDLDQCAEDEVPVEKRT